MDIAMKSTRTILALFIALSALPIVAFAQDEEAPIQVASNEEAIDDIVVVGQKSLSNLRRGIFKAEEDFYSVYNELNDDRDYDVFCRYERATGTNIKHHVCRARFVTKAFERHARRNRNNLSSVANQSADPVFAEQTAKYQEKMEVLIAANPELQAAFDRYNGARVQFMAKREDEKSN